MEIIILRRKLRLGRIPVPESVSDSSSLWPQPLHRLSPQNWIFSWWPSKIKWNVVSKKTNTFSRKFSVKSFLPCNHQKSKKTSASSNLRIQNTANASTAPRNFSVLQKCVQCWYSFTHIIFCKTQNLEQNTRSQIRMKTLAGVDSKYQPCCLQLCCYWLPTASRQSVTNLKSLTGSGAAMTTASTTQEISRVRSLFFTASSQLASCGGLLPQPCRFEVRLCWHYTWRPLYWKHLWEWVAPFRHLMMDKYQKMFPGWRLGRRWQRIGRL